jgi:toxin ParE1/3/4
MFEYIVSANAKEDLRRIYAYGLTEIGEQLADKYFHVFFSMFDKIATNPYVYQSVDHIRAGYRRCTCGSDSIYFRINGSDVEIMAILGGQVIDDWL